jgi:hypothetical protein
MKKWAALLCVFQQGRLGTLSSHTSERAHPCLLVCCAPFTAYTHPQGLTLTPPCLPCPLRVVLPGGKESVQNAYIRGSADGVALQTRDDVKFPTLMSLLKHYTSAAGEGVFPKLAGPLW